MKGGKYLLYFIFYTNFDWWRLKHFHKDTVKFVISWYANILVCMDVKYFLEPISKRTSKFYKFPKLFSKYAYLLNIQ